MTTAHQLAERIADASQAWEDRDQAIEEIKGVLQEYGRSVLLRARTNLEQLAGVVAVVRGPADYALTSAAAALKHMEME